MRRKLAIVLLSAGLVAVPAGCLLSVSVVTATVAAASLPTSCATTASSEAPECPASAVAVPSGVSRIRVAEPDPQASIAVGAALTAVDNGGRYVPEGNGPVDFDCSGLTSYAWREAGVNLVDYSYTQRAQTQDIPRSMVQPGDLVFWFGGSEHHVAIVTSVEGPAITIAEAANPEAGIRTRLLGGSWDEAYLTGFGRVVRG